MVIRHLGYKQQKAAQCVVWNHRLVYHLGAQQINSRKLCTPLERHKLITSLQLLWSGYTERSLMWPRTPWSGRKRNDDDTVCGSEVWYLCQTDLVSWWSLSNRLYSFYKHKGFLTEVSQLTSCATFQEYVEDMCNMSRVFTYFEVKWRNRKKSLSAYHIALKIHDHQ